MTTADTNLTHGTTVALSSLFSVSVAESDTITAYQIWDATADPLSGHFLVNGVAQPERAVIDLTPSQLGLTTREDEVLQLLGRGYTNRQIAAELTISVKTASVHVSHILRKLGAPNRLEAAAIAHRLAVPDS